MKKWKPFLTPLLDLVPHHIVFVDAQGIITLCNLQAAVDTGVDRDAIIGKHIRELLKLPDELIATLESLVKRRAALQLRSARPILRHRQHPVLFTTMTDRSNESSVCFSRSI
ncbi:hypothetical protein DI43_07410 [Geobacillus sp. CAMR12739]|nr:hypothetical protein DI43_07410 [Geobacillus sp. CAMR12739]